MCNLYNIKVDPRTYFDALAAVDDASNTLEVEKDYAAPGKPGYVVRVEEGRRVLSTMRWGFPTRKPRKRPAREGELPFSTTGGPTPGTCRAICGSLGC